MISILTLRRWEQAPIGHFFAIGPCVRFPKPTPCWMTMAWSKPLPVHLLGMSTLNGTKLRRSSWSPIPLRSTPCSWCFQPSPPFNRHRHSTHHDILWISSVTLHLQQWRLVQQMPILLVMHDLKTTSSKRVNHCTLSVITLIHHFINYD